MTDDEWLHKYFKDAPWFAVLFFLSTRSPHSQVAEEREESLTALKLIRGFRANLKEIAAAFSRSPKKSDSLRALQANIDETPRLPEIEGETRWHRFYNMGKVFPLLPPPQWLTPALFAYPDFSCSLNPV